MDIQGVTSAIMGLVGALVLASLLWIGTTIQETSINTIRMQGDIALMRQTVDTLRVQIEDMVGTRYTKEDSIADKRFHNLQHDALVKRVEALEKK